MGGVVAIIISLLSIPVLENINHVCFLASFSFPIWSILTRFRDGMLTPEDVSIWESGWTPFRPQPFDLFRYVTESLP